MADGGLLAVVLAGLAAGVAVGESPSEVLRSRVGRGATGVAARPPARLAGGLAVVVARRVQRRAGRGQHQAESDVAAACLALAAELRTGSPPRQALIAVAADWPDLLGGVARRTAVGGDVAAAFRAAAGAPGAAALAAVAAGWD
ncbi:MAG: hypothetical protein ACRDWI_13210, partial [Jiangellaceae bacterium]